MLFGGTAGDSGNPCDRQPGSSHQASSRSDQSLSWVPNGRRRAATVADSRQLPLSPWRRRCSQFPQMRIDRLNVDRAIPSVAHQLRQAFSVVSGRSVKPHLQCSRHPSRVQADDIQARAPQAVNEPGAGPSQVWLLGLRTRLLRTLEASTTGPVHRFMAGPQAL